MDAARATSSDPPADPASVAVDGLFALEVDEAIRLCGGRTTWSTHGVASMGLAPIVLSDGPHGVRRTVTDEAIIAAEPATCFPPAVTLAASWDPALVAEVGEAIGHEARAQGVAVVLGPGANIKRHPLGGRNFEYFSEDPLLSGELAAGMIEGIQRAGVGACLKHFVANNQETRRMTVDVVVDERALREIYLAGFERAIAAREPWMVMSAYNRLNGRYCSEDPWLLGQVLRDEWGFRGATVTDWGAANDRVAGLAAGLDLEMPGSGSVNHDPIRRAIESDAPTAEAFDDTITRLVALLRAGNAAVGGRSADEPPPRTVERDEEHHELARRAAAAGCVLLTNDGLLPLEPTGTIAVIGGFATDPRYQGAGSSQVTPTAVDTLLEAMRTRTDDGLRIVHAAGYDPHADEPRRDLHDEAVLVAHAADVAVVVVGLPDTYESEGFDRTHLRLPEHHDRLVRAVCDVNPNTVVVLANGSPVQLPWIDRPRAVLDAFLGGQGGGEGLARVLLGEEEPGGRLAETFPLRPSDHGSDAWFPGEGRQVQYRESILVGYRWFDTVQHPVLFPFGHGLSYTTFEYSDLAVAGLDEGRFDARSDAASDSRVTVGVRVTNTGTRPGSEVVQLYVRRPDSAIDRAAQELVAFAKVRLEPGETASVELVVDRRALAHWDAGAGGWRVESTPAELAVGASSRDLRATARVDVVGDADPVDHAAHTGHRVRSAADLADDDRFRRLLGRDIPAPDPIEPFHRNSTLEDVATTGLGRGLRAGAIRSARHRFGRGGDVDEVTSHLIERAMSEAPLRLMVLFSGGKLSWANLDRMISAMNAARRWGRRARRSRSESAA